MEPLKPERLPKPAPDDFEMSNPPGPTFIIGDIHGQFDKLANLLRAQGLVSQDLDWCGGTAALWFMGDFFDRGSDGLKVLDHIMRWQQQAALAGGKVDSIIGNHDVLLLAVRRFGHRFPAISRDFVATWKRNGGQQADLDGLTQGHIDWLVRRPAMKLLQTLLLVHADALFYRDYGTTIAGVNRSFAKILHRDRPEEWDWLLDRFCEHYCFHDRRAGGHEKAMQFLDTFGGSRLIHGHSPIHGMSGVSSAEVKEPYFYAHRLCVNVDGGMYAGGPGFIFEIPEDWL